MYFAFTEEQEEFRASLRSLVTNRASSSRIREVLDSGYDPMLWKLLVEEMGLPGMHVPEEFGGQGFGYLETAVVMQELGRSLAPVPMAATTFAIEAILRCGSPEQRGSVLPELAGGVRTGALAVSASTDLWAEHTRVAATHLDGKLLLCGRLCQVLHGHAADLLVVPALDVEGGGVALYLVDATAPGVHVEKVDSLDLTRPVAKVVFSGAEAERLGTGNQTECFDRVLDVARALLAFESLGTAERCRDDTVEYAKTRVQFNRPVGSFQSIKHRCSEMAIEINASYGAAMYAAMVIDSSPAEFAQTAPLAKAQAAETLRLCAYGMLQIHGGIGFTWEHDAHLYYRRAKANEVLFGDIDELRMLMADRVGL